MVELLFSCAPQSISKNYTDVYNLHFSVEPDSTIVYPWMENAGYLGYNCIPYNFRLYSRKNIKELGPLVTEFEQRIILPVHKENEGRLLFESRGENLREVSILLDGLDSEEKCIFSDTLKFVPDSVLSIVSKVIPLHGIDMLNIRIHAEGNEKEEAYIVLSQLDIKIGNKDINEYPLRELPSLSLNKNIKIIPFQPDTKEICERIDEFKDKRILALGESIHGNSSIRHLVYKLMIENVKNQSCKLLIWEMPMEMSFVYNRYVTDQSFTLDSVETSIIDSQRMEFMNELKQYNSIKKGKDKVQLLGMDYSSTWNPKQNTAIYIFDFLTHLNRKQKILAVDYLSVLLMEKDWNKAIEYINEHKDEIQRLLTADELECILHILTLSRDMGMDRSKRFIGRDSVMFVNTKFLLDHFSASSNRKAVVYSHAVHINPISTYPVVHCTPLGKYLKEQYSDDYWPVLLLIGQGSATLSDGMLTNVERKLQNPPAGSIESLLNQVESNVSYIPMISHFNHMSLSRMKGNRHTSQEFYPYNLYQRYKGIFFIKNPFVENRDKDSIILSNAIKHFLQRERQRPKILEDLKRRVIVDKL